MNPINPMTHNQEAADNMTLFAVTNFPGVRFLEVFLPEIAPVEVPVIVLTTAEVTK